MYCHYFEDWVVKPDFKKEFISLWSGWLGKEDCHKLDEVTENEWQRFNQLIELISEDYKIELVSCDKERLIPITDVRSVLSSYEEAMEKDSSLFSKFVVPELGCVISEEWDYTYILWYKSDDVVEKLSPYIKLSNLCHFS
ncbi:conserved hypothetical protein [Vibrio chagasii]|uniref:hypothetical protein n=1 Tax=Vibrio chagasii TaxID=170679 RepID=UPI001EFE461D|nr:hypothetical protein [Vibrio chagasii]MDE9380278.1 hypothetical protein [Vibrio alginolyticus]MCG9604440.1 hypothetical protein [Vibrio chagasii]CAH6938478.1 conserved hypothetical protein [Vibrio chagasii]CAH7146681.1 conserved hypothetical protein [Vibrio chagasii]CAH7192511.1 conserved hypothetical protein [Vibrio chagasii]